MVSIATSLKNIPHPGELIQDELDARAWDRGDLAKWAGLDESAITPVLSGRQGISPEMAEALSRGLGISAGYFINMQKTYDAFMARQNPPAQNPAHPSLASTLPLFNRPPLIST